MYIVEIGNGAMMVGPFETKAEAEAYVEKHRERPAGSRWYGYSFTVHALHRVSAFSYLGVGA